MGIISKKAAMAAAKSIPRIAMSLDASQFAYMDKEKAMDAVLKEAVRIAAQAEADKEGAGKIRTSWKRGTLTVSDQKLRNGITVQATGDLAMAAIGAASIKVQEAVGQSESAMAEKLLSGIAEYIKELPAENYAGAPFAAGWMQASAMEEILIRYMEQEGIGKDQLYNMKIWAADDRDDSFRVLYSAGFSVSHLYITKQQQDEHEPICHIPVNSLFQKQIAEAVSAKVKESKELGNYYQEMAKGVMEQIPDAVMESLRQIEPGERSGKKDADQTMLSAADAKFSEFLDGIFPHAAHYMETNDLGPEISFEFSYATAPSAFAAAPQNMFSRYCSSRGWFDMEQQKEFKERMDDGIRIAAFVREHEGIMEQITDSIQRSADRLNPCSIQEKGFAEAMLEEFQRQYESMEAVRRCADNEGELSYILQDGVICGIEAHGNYIHESMEFSEDAQMEFFERTWQAVEEQESEFDDEEIEAAV